MERLCRSAEGRAEGPYQTQLRPIHAVFRACVEARVLLFGNFSMGVHGHGRKLHHRPSTLHGAAEELCSLECEL